MKKLTALAPLAIALLTPKLYAETSTSQLTPELQIEVIIFSQQDVYNSEKNHKKPTLSFPDNHRFLENPLNEQSSSVLDGRKQTEQVQQPSSTIDCQTTTDSRFEQFDATAGTQTAEEPALAETIEPVLASSLPTTLSSNGELSEAALESEPESEQSYLILDKSEWQLSREAYTLKRKAGFEVLYHQAWRQPKLSKADSQWIVIQGGKQTAGRHQLEGAIRLYQSRFPHFQANLWQTKLTGFTFNNLNLAEDSPNWLSSFELPAIPSLLDQGESEQQLQPCLIQTKPEITPNPFKDALANESSDSLTASEERTNPVDYRVLDIQQFKQSARLHYNKPAYLDHPSIGILLLLSSYQPVEPVIEAQAENALSTDQPAP